MPILLGQPLQRILRRLGWYSDDADANAWVRPGGVVLPMDIAGWQLRTRIAEAQTTLPSPGAGTGTLRVLFGGEVDPVRLLSVTATFTIGDGGSWQSGSEAWFTLELIAADASEVIFLTPIYDLASSHFDYEVGRARTITWQPPSEMWLAGEYVLVLNWATSVDATVTIVGQALYNAYPGGAS